MWPFRRRTKTGRHELGAAVTAIPASPRVADPPVAPYHETVPAPAMQPAARVLPAPPQAAPPAVETVPVAAPVEATGPRVELGFRDGSTAALPPGSDQARALSAIASVLIQRS